jgi:hypothetical protein
MAGCFFGLAIDVTSFLFLSLRDRKKGGLLHLILEMKNIFLITFLTVEYIPHPSILFSEFQDKSSMVFMGIGF